jgi:hypothetical protein
VRTALGATLAAGLVVGLVLTGCASTGTTRTSGADGLTTGLPAAASSTSGTSDQAPTGTEGPFGPDGPDASDTPDPALSGRPLPTLPAGDPGTGPASPSSEPADDDATHAPGEPVPAPAMLDTATMAALAGGSWIASPAPHGWCAAPRTPGARTARTQLLESADGRLVQSVTAYDGPAPARAAVRAVAVATERLRQCGFTVDGDPRLGAASEQLTRTAADGTEQVVVVLAAEGVGVVLLASGTPAARGTWESLADLALGSSCAAAAHGCH